jgi:hypothetical protein
MLGLIVITVLQVGQPARVGTKAITDACEAKIPQSLERALTQRFPAYRLPLVTDNLAEDVQSSVKRGGNGCLLVAGGDFDGDGVKDFAVGLIPDKDSAPLVAVALARKGRWLVSTVKSWVDGPMRLYMDAVPPGLHRRSEALDGPLEPTERQSLRCGHTGLIVGATESTGIVYCYVNGQWLYVWVSD